MPSTINRGKLIAILERRRSAHLLQRDLADRMRDAREAVNRFRNIIRADAQGDDHVDALLRLPLAEAQALPEAQVVSFRLADDDAFKAWARANGRNADSERPQFEARINLNNWRTYVRELATLERLTAEHERQRAAYDEQFAVVDGLIDFTKKQRLWGQDLEV